jgi:hypothetical protein
MIDPSLAHDPERRQAFQHAEKTNGLAAKGDRGAAGRQNDSLFSGEFLAAL